RDGTADGRAGAGRADLVLHRRTHGDLSDLHAGRLVDRECNRFCHRFGRNTEGIHVSADLLAYARVVDRAVEVRVDESWRYSGSADHAVGGLLTKSLQHCAHGILGGRVDPHVRNDLQTRGRDRGDEVAVALSPKYGKRRGNTVQHAPEVDVDHRRPTLDVEV